MSLAKWLLAVVLATGATQGRAQAPLSGYAVCHDCRTLTDTDAERAVLWVFKEPFSGDGRPDIQFDQRPAGGSSSCLTVLSQGSYLVPADWRLPEAPRDDFHVFITNGRWVLLDSGNMSETLGSLDLVDEFQVAGVLAGHLSPDVATVGTGVEVRWTPLREQGHVPGQDCNHAGELPRGFIIGYDVYRLPLATFPSPTLRDFATSGFLSFADLRLLDFGVADPDGSSGSDLDPSDGLRLVNPDGLPDTGDEILVLTDLAGSTSAHWYRLQPVVTGDAAGFDTIGFCHAPPSNTRLDLTGDTVPDAVDLLSDGILDFIDPSHSGLGLTWSGEILSSPLAGLGAAVPGAVDCDPLLPEVCGNGLDDDSNGLADCEDPACCASAGCPPAATLTVTPTTACPGDSIQVDASASSPGACPASLEYRFEAPRGSVMAGGDWGPAPVRMLTPGWRGTSPVHALARCTAAPGCVGVSPGVMVTVGTSPTYTFPSALAVTSMPGCGYRVEWSPASGAGPFVYDVYRHSSRPVPLDAAHLVASGLAATEWLDAPPGTGDWTYRVVALSGCAALPNGGGDSAPLPRLAFPSVLVVSPDAGCASRVEWSTATTGRGPVSYSVYRSESRPVPLDPAHLVAAGLSSNDHVDVPSAPGDWSYRVVATDSCESVPNGGGDSAPLPRLAFPSGLAVSPEAGCASRIEWSTATTGRGPVSYSVYRSESRPVPLDPAHLVAAGISSNDHLDVPPAPGDWSYRVVATDSCESLPNGGGDSAPLPRLAFPSVVRAASEGPCSVRVTWDAPTSLRPPVVHDVYRSATAPVPLDPAHLAAAGLAGTSWLDPAPWGPLAHYRVVARDGCDSTPNGGGDSAPVAVTDTTPPLFGGIVDTRDLGYCQVEVAWDESTASDDCSGIGGYDVFRDHGVAHAGRTLVASGVPGSPYVDTTPGNGTWVYVVRAVDRAGNREGNTIFQQQRESSCRNDFPRDPGLDRENGMDPPNADRLRSAPGDPRVLDSLEIRRRMDAGDMTIRWRPSDDEGGLHPVTYSVLRGTLASLRGSAYDHALVAPDACGLAAHELLMTDQLDGVDRYYLVAAVSGDNATFGYDSTGRPLPAAPACE